MAVTEQALPPLIAGERLSRAEFMRRWEAMPDVKFAELLRGVVYMSSPLSRPHGTFDRRIAHWLGHYELHTPGCDGASNTTWLMTDEDVPQPDQDMRIIPARGGQSRDEGNYGAGAPEFLAEIWTDREEQNVERKQQIYRDAGVIEYLAVFVAEEKIEWHYRSGEAFELLKPDEDEITRSRVFPGLWLDPRALFASDLPRLIAVLSQGLATPEHAAFVARLAAQRHV